MSRRSESSALASFPGFGSRVPDNEELDDEEHKATTWPIDIRAESQFEKLGVSAEPLPQTVGQETSSAARGGTPADSSEIVEVRGAAGAPEPLAEVQFICTDCGMNFPQMSHLQAHQLQSHSGSQSHGSSRSFRCLWCGKTWTQLHPQAAHAHTYRRAAVCLSSLQPPLPSELTPDEALANAFL